MVYLHYKELGMSERIPYSQVFRRILDYSPLAHQRMLDNTQDLHNLELTAKALGKRGVDYDYALMGDKDNRGHSTDLGKLVNHPTFSNESAFANPRYPGGAWGYNGKQDTFTPTQRQQTSSFDNYMNRYEPNVKIIRN